MAFATPASTVASIFGVGSLLPPHPMIVIRAIMHIEIMTGSFFMFI